MACQWETQERIPQRRLKAITAIQELSWTKAPKQVRPLVCAGNLKRDGQLLSEGGFTPVQSSQPSASRQSPDPGTLFTVCFRSRPSRARQALAALRATAQVGFRRQRSRALLYCTVWVQRGREMLARSRWQSRAGTCTEVHFAVP